MFVRRKTFNTDTSSQALLFQPKPKYGTHMRRNRYKRIRTSHRKNLHSNGTVSTEPDDTSDTQSRKEYMDCARDIARCIGTTNHSTNSSLTASTETLVEKLTSTPSVANTQMQRSIDFETIPDDIPNELNQSENCSFDVLQCKI